MNIATVQKQQKGMGGFHILQRSGQPSESHAKSGVVQPAALPPNEIHIRGQGRLQSFQIPSR